MIRDLRVRAFMYVTNDCDDLRLTRIEIIHLRHTLIIGQSRTCNKVAVL